MENHGTATWYLECCSLSGAVKLHKRNLEIHHYTHNTLQHGPFTRLRDSEEECPRYIFWKVIDGALRQKDSRIFLGKTDFPRVLWQAFPTSLLTRDIKWYLLPGRGNRPAASSLHVHLKHPFYKEATRPHICWNCVMIHWPARQIETKSYDLPVGVMSHDGQIHTLYPNMLKLYQIIQDFTKRWKLLLNSKGFPDQEPFTGLSPFKQLGSKRNPRYVATYVLSRNLKSTDTDNSWSI